jgi:hypothetical protein
VLSEAHLLDNLHALALLPRPGPKPVQTIVDFRTPSAITRQVHRLEEAEGAELPRPFGKAAASELAWLQGARGFRQLFDAAGTTKPVTRHRRGASANRRAPRTTR